MRPGRRASLLPYSMTGAGNAARLIFVLLSLAVAAYAFAYLYGDFRPRNPFDRRFALAGLAVPMHFFGAGLALVMAPLQLWQGLRRRLPRLHRLAGWLYAGGVLIGGLGGLMLAPDAQAGWASGSGFLLLAACCLRWSGSRSRPSASSRPSPAASTGTGAGCCAASR